MANELEALEKRQLSAQRSLNDLTNQLTLADHLVYKKYLAELQNYGMVTLSQEMLNVQNAADCIRMYQLKELTLKREEICSKSFLRCTIPAWRRAAVWR